MDIGEAEGDRVEHVHAPVELEGTSRRPAWKARTGRAGRFPDSLAGKSIRLPFAVDRPAGRGEDEAVETNLLRSFDQVDRADHVHGRVEGRFLDRTLDLAPGRKMENRLRADRLQSFSTSSRSRMSPSIRSAPAASADSRFWCLPVEKLSSTVTSSPRARRGIGEMRSDESGAACDKGLHGCES